MGVGKQINSDYEKLESHLQNLGIIKSNIAEQRILTCTSNSEKGGEEGAKGKNKSKAHY